MNIKLCNEKQLPEILAIFNEAILNSTALYDYKIRTLENIKDWYSEKQIHNYPIIGAFDIQDNLLGFATYGQFRIRPAYKYTVEHSVYVRIDKRGQGIAKNLLQELIAIAKAQDYHVIVGVIDALNLTSIKLHEKQGFKLNGIINEVGYKFGKWLDAAFYQLILDSPKSPNEE